MSFAAGTTALGHHIAYRTNSNFHGHSFSWVNVTITDNGGNIIGSTLRRARSPAAHLEDHALGLEEEEQLVNTVRPVHGHLPAE